MKGGGQRRLLCPKPNGHKDRDEDLLLFREIHKREKERIASLLQPVSDEFEPNSGNYPLYRIASAKKGSGYEFLAGGNKNDYDWLKTPPATPLFPSLEMEANAPDLVVHREIPILQPLSRFSSNSEAPKEGNGRSLSPSPKPKIPPRSTTRSGRSSISLAEAKNPKGPLILNQKVGIDPSKRSNLGTIKSKPTTQQESDANFITTNLLINMRTDSKMKPTSRGVSPLVRTKIPAQIPGFSDETPPNLKTDRSSSASRDRSCNPVLSSHQKSDSTAKPRRQSCSPSVARNRKVQYKQESEGNLTTQKGRTQTANAAQVLGSRMVDKVMNARKSGAEERETKPNLRGLITENPAYGRTTSKSSLDMALKHMAIKREQSNSRNISLGRRFKTSGSTSH